MPTTAIIVAAGTSQRMGFDKLTADLCGKPVLQHSVEAFLQCPLIDHIIVVTTEERFALLESVIFGREVHRVDGGSNRQNSVEAGILALPQDTTLVAIHDGARPMIRVEDITKCIVAAKQYGGATLAREVTETLKRADNEGFTRNAVERKDLWFMETPQCFRANLLRRAYANVKDRRMTVTDEVSALESIGVATKIIASSRPNIKVTLPGDIPIVAQMMFE